MQCWKRRWFCGTKANYVCVAGVGNEGGFVVRRQIMFVLRVEFLKLVSWYQGKSCLFWLQNVKIWFNDTKPNHFCAMDGMLKVGFADQGKSCLYDIPTIGWWLCGQD
jgi:hypothetical protein